MGFLPHCTSAQIPNSCMGKLSTDPLGFLAISVRRVSKQQIDRQTTNKQTKKQTNNSKQITANKQTNKKATTALP